MKIQKTLHLTTLAVLVISQLGCSLEHVPASIVKNSLPNVSEQVEVCVWKPLPEAEYQLTDFVELRNDVITSIGIEECQLSFDPAENYVAPITLVTGAHGAMYYMKHTAKNTNTSMFGRWCGWNDSTVQRLNTASFNENGVLQFDSSNKITLPSESQLLPDKEGKIFIQSNGGIQFEAKWNSTSDPRGLAFVLSGLGLSQRQYSTDVLMRALFDNGWAVVHLYAVPVVPRYSSTFNLKSSAEPQNLANEIIRLFDSRYSQLSGATKAIRAFMHKQIPSLSTSPTVIVGISAGAINTPAVYHSMKDEIDTVVLVAGGANMLRIVQDGAFTKWKFADAKGNKFNKTELKKIEEAFLKTPSKDPYHLAAELPRENTLLVHAKFDAAVPAKFGDILWERAGRPERWLFSGGHIGLFVTFSWHADDIVQWINSKSRPQN